MILLNNIGTVIFYTYIVILIFFALRKNSEVKSESSYLLADRRTSLFPLIATLVMTEFNTSTLVGFSSAGYFGGIWAVTLPSVFLIGLLFYTFVVAKKWRSLKAISVAELFTAKYGKGVGRLASIFLILAMLAFSANYVKSLQILFQPMFPELNPKTLSFFIIIIILVFTLRGGLKTIIQTDIVSFIATLIFLPALLYFAISASPSNYNFIDFVSKSDLKSSQSAIPPSFVFSLVVLTMFTYIASPWYGQKIFSSIDEKTAFLAVGISAILIFILYSIPVLALAYLKYSGIKLDSAENGIPYIISKQFPEIGKGFAYAVLFSAGATTLTGVMGAISSMVIADFLDKKEEGSYKRSLFITFIAGIIIYLISITFIDKILDKLILANIPIAALSFSLLAAFYWENVSKTGAYASILTGILVGILSYLYFGEKGGYTIYWAFYGIPAIFFVGFCFSKIFKNRKI